MKTINDTTKFTDSQARPNLKPVISLELYRRFWQDLGVTPVSVFHFNESSWNGVASEVVDDVGINEGVAGGSANTIIDGFFGRAGRFGIAATDNVNCGNNASINDFATFTIFARIKKNSNTGGNETIISKGRNTGGVHTGYSLLGLGGTTFRGEVQQGGALASSTSSTPLSLDVWYGLCIKYDPSASRYVKLYIDGVEVSYGASSNGAGAKVADAALDFRVGNCENLDGGFDGTIDEVIVFDSALPDAQILAVSTMTEQFRDPGFFWEMTPVVDLDDYYIKNSLNDILWQLDTTALNVFKLGNVQFELDNSDNIWDDSAAETIWDGYTPYLSIVKITIGLVDIDGTTQSTYVFNGVIAKDGIKLLDNYNRRAKIKVLGLEELLRQTNAEDLSQSSASTEVRTADISSATTVGKTGAGWGVNAFQFMCVRILTGTGAGQVRNIASNTADTLTVNAWTTEPDDSPDIEIFGDIPAESPSGAGDTVFTAGDNGIGIIKNVYVNDTLVLPGDNAIATEYAIATLNDPDNPAVITFGAGLNLNDNVVMEYIFWYQDQTIKWLVDNLLETADITNRLVEDATFDNNVEVTVSQTSKADWDAYVTKTQIETSPAAYEDFVEGDVGTELDNNVDADTGVVFDNEFPSTIEAAQTFEVTSNGYIPHVKVNIRKFNNPTGNIKFSIHSIIGTARGAELASGVIDMATVGAAYSLTQINMGTSPRYIVGNKYILIMNIAGDASNWIQWSYDTGNPYADGEAGFIVGATFVPQSGSDMGMQIFLSTYFATGHMFSTTIDGTASLAAWGMIITTNVQPVNTDVKFYTRTQAADAGWPVTWDAAEWVEIDGVTGAILSDINRYLKIAIRFTNTDVGYTSYVSDLTLTYFTDEFLIELANLTGLSVWDAIKELGNMPDYELGFNTENDGQFLPRFFFRSKIGEGNPDIEISDIDNVIKARDYDNGITRVFNQIDVTFGGFTRTVDINSNPEETRPNTADKYKINRLSVSSGQLVGDENVNIAQGIGLRYYNNYKAPKRTLKIDCNYLIQVDLSDKVRLTMKEPTLGDAEGRGEWDDGDSWDSLNGYWDEETLWFLFEVDFKVTGMRIQERLNQVELTLKEI